MSARTSPRGKLFAFTTQQERTLPHPYHDGQKSHHLPRWLRKATADLLTVKLMFNSVISTPSSKFITIDIKDFYRMTPMDQYEYFQMKLDLSLPDIIKKYGHRDKVITGGDVFCEVQRGMYGFPQATS